MEFKKNVVSKTFLASGIQEKPTGHWEPNNSSQHSIH